jgi:hypothetical protein
MVDAPGKAFTTINDVKRLYLIELCGGESGEKAANSISIFMNEVVDAPKCVIK